MFGYLFSSLSAHNNNEQNNMKRQHTRRENDQCVIMIEGQLFPVQNWSMGGALINTDEQSFGLHDEVGVTIKFKVGEIVRDVTQLARVVRKSRGKIAFEFAPLGHKSYTNFQHIINECVSAQFADSQRA